MSAIKFKLSLSPNPSEHKFYYGDRILLIGSCFTENMGAKLRHHLFETLENPHGILFNPVSVKDAIYDYINNRQYTAAELFYWNNIWNSWQHHSRFSGITQEEALAKINDSIAHAHSFLKTANHLVITLGSSWLYTLTELATGNLGRVVANNHKAPANWFTKKLMNNLSLTESLDSLLVALKQFNPSLRVVFTISPVRHLREGLVENNRSKAVLIQSVHDVVDPLNGVDYFPAYEYVIDDLRDYRFYAEDLVHPNYTATNYVWEKFVETYMDSDTQNVMKQVAELQLAVNHKPFFAGSTAHQQFLKSSLEKTEALFAKMPHLPLQNHLQFFKSQIEE